MSQRKKPRGKQSPTQAPTLRNLPAKNPAQDRPIRLAAHLAETHIFLGQRFALALLVTLTLIAYANAWPDSLTFDDRVFADRDRFTGLGWVGMARFFTEDLWSAIGASSGLYRPLLLVLIAFESWVFGDWFAGYHLVNILLHVLATVLVYGFVRHILRRLETPPSAVASSALLAAVVFGVHPIHTEVVNSIFNGSEILVSIGVVGGLWWFLQTLPVHAKKAWFGLCLVYLLVLFCRESGAALPALATAMVWLCEPGPWKVRLRKCLPVLWLLIPLALYLALRAHALGGQELVDSAVAAGQSEQLKEFARPERAFNLKQLWSTVSSTAGEMGFHPKKLGPAVTLWFESWKIMLWPHPLQIYYDKPDTSVWLALSMQLALLTAALFAYLKKRPGLLIGTAFFYLAILPSSAAFGQSNALAGLADRILYLPSVGLTIIVAVGLSVLVQRAGLRTAVGLFMLLTMLLMPLTWARNAEWASDITLFESAYNKLENKRVILNTLLAGHLREGNFNRAVEICDAHSNEMQKGKSLGVHCGSAYGRVGRFTDAEQAYLNASSNDGMKIFAHFNLAMMYVYLGRKSEAMEQFESAISAEKDAFMQEYFRALMLLELHPNEREKLLEARTHLEQALQLQPQHVLSRQELDRLNARLQASKANGQ